MLSKAELRENPDRTGLVLAIAFLVAEWGFDATAIEFLWPVLVAFGVAFVLWAEDWWPRIGRAFTVAGAFLFVFEVIEWVGSVPIPW
jgi:hypothetical protein